MSRFSMILVVLLVLVFAVAVSGQLGAGWGLFVRSRGPSNQTASMSRGDGESSQMFSIILVTLAVAALLFFAFGPRL